MENKKEHYLYAPEGYWNATAKQREYISNGCGSKGFGFLVPDTFYGMDISEACDIHDWMYHYGRTIGDKDQADRAFLNNLLRIVDKTKWGWLRWLRRRRAKAYYEAVHLFGGPAFWSGKND